MCGIAGVIHRSASASAGDLGRALELLAHRGPDSAGTFVAGRCAIGQTRLSIIDLVTGDPPITAADGRVGAVCNGEIYNYEALRRQLAARGHRFTTHGDTEVIAHLAEDESPTGIATVLEGMFAFATWDARRERLVIGRDRLGKKPLYLWRGADRIAFASEIKALRAIPGVPSDLDPSVIPVYLGLGYAPTPTTFFRGIEAVPPGSTLTIDGDLRVTSETYWRPPHGGGTLHRHVPTSIDAAATAVRRELERAVQDRMVSDVPIGAFLSGGIDSTAIVGLMSARSPSPVRTFTIGFDDRDGFDERPYARIAAERFGTEHTELVVHPDAVDLVERLVWHHDQPFGDSSAVPMYLLSELTSAHVTVALSGDGGDEVFGGYERFAMALFAARYTRLPAPARRAAGPLLALVRSPRLQRFLGIAGLGAPDALRSWIAYIEDPLLRDLVPGADASASHRAAWERSSGAPTLDRLLHVNLETYLLDDLLPKADRMSMAHGLEVRSPFLDHRLIELVAALPPSTKIRGRTLKRVLRRAVADLVPTALLERPKHGFGVPLDRWFREDLRAYVDATLGAPGASVRAHVRGDVLDRILAEHRSGAARHGHVLWTLLTLEVFLRREGW